jgi:hypothetical protein
VRLPPLSPKPEDIVGGQFKVFVVKLEEVRSGGLRCFGHIIC